MFLFLNLLSNKAVVVGSGHFFVDSTLWFKKYYSKLNFFLDKMIKFNERFTMDIVLRKKLKKKINVKKLYKCQYLFKFKQFFKNLKKKF